MKIAIISDIHGNYPALKAVVEDAVKNDVDKFIFAGDYVFDLPYPNEVTDLIRSLTNYYVIQGNKEAYLKKLSTEAQENWIYEQMGAVYQTYRELKLENLNYLTNLSEDCLIDLPYHGKIYVTHYIYNLFGEQSKTTSNSARFTRQMRKAPFSHEEFLKYVSESILTDEKIRSKISEIDSSVIIFGHSHIQWFGYCEDKLIINPGSCGQPLDSNVLAPYTILEDTKEGLEVIEKRVSYDIEETISFSKQTEIYKQGIIWSELVFKAMTTGQDYFAEFFELAESIAKDMNESGSFFSNETWNHAGSIFFNK